jgi:hypothetical protein
MQSIQRATRLPLDGYWIGFLCSRRRWRFWNSRHLRHRQLSRRIETSWRRRLCSYRSRTPGVFRSGSLDGMKGSSASGFRGKGVPGASEVIINAAWDASHWSYARAYRLGFWSLVPFVALATIAVACMQVVKKLMTEKVEATVEPDSDDEKRY